MSIKLLVLFSTIAFTQPAFSMGEILERSADGTPSSARMSEVVFTYVKLAEPPKGFSGFDEELCGTTIRISGTNGVGDLAMGAFLWASDSYSSTDITDRQRATRSLEPPHKHSDEALFFFQFQTADRGVQGLCFVGGYDQDT